MQMVSERADVVPRTVEWRRRYWAERVMEWRHSGESQTAYCRCCALRPDRFGRWKRALEGRSPGNGFVELRLSVDLASAGPSLWVQLGDLRIGIGTEADLGLLSRVVVALRRA